ncbi:MAG: hypothetical protein ACI4MN_02840 [Candidatus Coproplasma sp.]
MTDDEKSSIHDALRFLAEKFKEKVVEVLAAVHGRTAKGLTQVYQRILRLKQLGVEIVTPKYDKF